MKRLDKAFYQRSDVTGIARELIGKVLVTNIDGQVTSGIIIETEAYAGADDRASHAYGNRRTARNEAMYAEGGTAYVFLCYGIHHLFNVVTNVKDIPHAILIRGIQPMEGIPAMLLRRNRPKADKRLAGGPGTLSQALGIDLQHNALDLVSDEKIQLVDMGIKINQKKIITTPRIGIDYAGADARLPYRHLHQETIEL